MGILSRKIFILSDTAIYSCVTYCSLDEIWSPLLVYWCHLHALNDGCPQMTWGRTLENALKSKAISKDFDEWIAIAKDRSKWRQLTHSIPKPPDA